MRRCEVVFVYLQDRRQKNNVMVMRSDIQHSAVVAAALVTSMVRPRGIAFSRRDGGLLNV